MRHCGLRHPSELGSREVREFLTDLADRGKLSASSQTQALAALLFLYRGSSSSGNRTAAAWWWSRT